MKQHSSAAIIYIWPCELQIKNDALLKQREMFFTSALQINFISLHVHLFLLYHLLILGEIFDFQHIQDI